MEWLHSDNALYTAMFTTSLVAQPTTNLVKRPISEVTMSVIAAYSLGSIITWLVPNKFNSGITLALTGLSLLILAKKDYTVHENPTSSSNGLFNITVNT